MKEAFRLFCITNWEIPGKINVHFVNYLHTGCERSLTPAITLQVCPSLTTMSVILQQPMVIWLVSLAVVMCLHFVSSDGKTCMFLESIAGGKIVEKHLFNLKSFQFPQ